MRSQAQDSVQGVLGELVAHHGRGDPHDTAGRSAVADAPRHRALLLGGREVHEQPAAAREEQDALQTTARHRFHHRTRLDAGYSVLRYCARVSVEYNAPVENTGKATNQVSSRSFVAVFTNGSTGVSKLLFCWLSVTDEIRFLGTREDPTTPVRFCLRAAFTRRQSEKRIGVKSTWTECTVALDLDSYIISIKLKSCSLVGVRTRLSANQLANKHI